MYLLLSVAVQQSESEAGRFFDERLLQIGTLGFIDILFLYLVEIKTRYEKK